MSTGKVPPTVRGEETVPDHSTHKVKRRILSSLCVGVFGALAVVITLGLPVTAMYAQSVGPGCSPPVVPIGQVNPAPTTDPMPLDPAWCNTFTAGPTSFTSGTNDWIDTFSNAHQMQRFADGDNGYHVFNNLTADASNPARAGIHVEHFINNNGWFDDSYAAGQSNVGGTVRPDRSFAFEAGKLVVEADVAAGEMSYANSGDVVFPEIDISQAANPNPSLSAVTDPLYGYGQFGGSWTVGCRLDASKSGNNPVICAVESAARTVVDNASVCNQSAPSRIMEISDFEVCGSTHHGGSGGGVDRSCPPNTPYDGCLDRFRLEITKTGLTVYVNGVLYFEDANWDAAHQLPDSMISGQSYVYFTDWVSSANTNMFRFNWERLAVNPHNPDGSLMGPSASPTFGGSSTPTPTPTSTLSPTPTLTPTVTLTPSLTPTPRHLRQHMLTQTAVALTRTVVVAATR
jgi:hypothetical protein